MAFKVRQLKKNKIASGSGVFLILVPFVISILLTAVFIPLGETGALGAFGLYLPESYENMTEQQRDNWLIETYGGEPYKEWRPDLQFWLIFPYLGQWYFVFPDGTEMTQEQYEKFKTGEAGQPDYVQIVKQTITIDPPALKRIGVFGVVIRIVLLASICIGLVDILWFG